jgi:predicted transcriptional regulator
MRTLHIGIASYEEMKARTLAIARGEFKPKPGDPQVWFPSPESFAKVLSNKNRALLQVIQKERPESILALSTATGRTTGNLSRTLRTMERYGLVRLHRGARGMVRPEVPFRDVRLKVELVNE